MKAQEDKATVFELSSNELSVVKITKLLRSRRMNCLCPKCDMFEARNLNWHISEAKLMRQHGLTANELSAVECS